MHENGNDVAAIDCHGSNAFYAMVLPDRRICFHFFFVFSFFLLEVILSEPLHSKQNSQSKTGGGIIEENTHQPDYDETP